ncbi:TPA: hypothetical protein ACQZLP_004773 [Klebsiella variicola subsp. variicola]
MMYRLTPGFGGLTSAPSLTFSHRLLFGLKLLILFRELVFQAGNLSGLFTL